MDNQTFICEKCGSEHDGSYGSGRFCSIKCARSYSTKNKSKDQKEAKCIKCGTNIYINKRASIQTCKCEKCKKEYHKPSDLKVCKICGSTYYKNHGGCSNEFCKTHRIQGFNLLIKFFGFNKDKIGTSEVEIEFNRVKKNIEDLYWKENMSSRDIAKKFNFPSKHSITQTVFKFLDIKPRSFKQATSNAFYTGKMKNVIFNQYKCEWHKSWNGKFFFLRSSYESDYANKLDTLKVEYEVESLRIEYYNSAKREYRCAVPDFYLPNTNTIVEIKSRWTLDPQEMKDKIKSYLENGYNFKLILNGIETEL